MRVSNFNQRRAAQERDRAARAVTEQARQHHLELAAIFEARAQERTVGPASEPRPA